MTKIQKILAGFLALQIALIAVVFLSNRLAIAGNNPLLPDYDATAVTAITISNNTGGEIVMQKKGTDWVLPDADDFPVLNQNVSDLLESIAEIRDNRLVTNTSASHKRLQVADTDYLKKIEIQDAKGTTTVYIGSTPAANSVHIRVGKSDAVYLTNAVSSNRIDPAYTNWINTSLVQIAGANVRTIAVTTPDGSFHFNLDASGSWTNQELTADESFDASKWSSLLSGFTNVRLVKPVATNALPAYGLDSPQASVTITYQDENNALVEGVLTIGNADETGSNYYAKWSQSPYIVLISSYNAERILDLSKNDFITIPPTATAQP